MLPNHNPFVIAEQFGTLDGAVPRPGRPRARAARRAPRGSSRQALRKNLHQASEYFPQDVVELRALLTGDVELPIVATPGLGARGRAVDARLEPVRRAARRAARAALRLRQPLRARPSRRRAGRLPQPVPPLGRARQAACDGGDDGDRRRDRRGGRAARLVAGPGLRPPAQRRSGQAAAAGRPAIATRLPASARAMLEHLGQARAVGSPETVRASASPASSSAPRPTRSSSRARPTIPPRGAARSS